jgi:hypothetical protein
VATSPTPETKLRDLNGNEYTLAEWVLLFNMAMTVIDPYRHESSWILDTAARIMRHYDEADVRVGFLATCDEVGARQFLGPLADEFLVFVDADRSFVREMELERLPALVHFRQDGELTGAAEGWDPEEWNKVVLVLEEDLAWRSLPQLPQSGDPRPYSGAPALD